MARSKSSCAEATAISAFSFSISAGISAVSYTHLTLPTIRLV